MSISICLEVFCYILYNYTKNFPEYKYNYTSEYGEVNVVFHSTSEYGDFIKSVGRLSKEDMDNIFMGLYEESPKAQEEYPRLIKK